MITVTMGGRVRILAKQIDAYFKNENDAEAVSARLQTLKVSNVSVEEIPRGTDTKVLVPFFPANTGTGTSGSVGPIAPLFDQQGKIEGDSETLKHLLHFEVEETDYHQALDVLKESDCYGHQSEIERS
ncbi:hypothetical protein [Virgibacillus senegalensis]|uniref:hypothetical protein n=1 Tax=Virgibacillus senegalensis TaxID=1499679 RepID=UPI00069DFDF1|nr:hypothetical protein [Virgibacillus senegalensis]